MMRGDAEDQVPPTRLVVRYSVLTRFEVVLRLIRIAVGERTPTCQVRGRRLARLSCRLFGYLRDIATSGERVDRLSEAEGQFLGGVNRPLHLGVG